jgi:beta-glucosidase
MLKLAALAAAAAVARATAAATASDELAAAPYRNAALPVPARVADLLARMTPAEKVAQLWTRESDARLEADCLATGIGGANIANARGATPAARLAARNAIQAACGKNRLGVPISFFEEGLHGGAAGGTVYPMPPTTACSWNVTLAAAIGAAIADEARGAGVDNVWSPVVNMWTDDRFGRFQEGFSPDATLTSHFGRALVTGLQGGASSQDDYLPGDASESVWSTAKHFAGCALFARHTAPAPARP